jgi:hypothetical protein
MSEAKQGVSIPEIVVEEPRPSNGSALVVRVDEPLVMDVARSLPMATAQFKAIQDFVKSVMVESVEAADGKPARDGDYGTVPGIAKPFLFKSGAEKLATLFGYAPLYVTLEKVEDFGERRPNGFFFYRYRCDLASKKTGSIMGSGIGSCNSMEDKYRWTQAQRVCPECGKATIIKGKKEFDRTGGEGGWVCWSRKEIACGAKWPDGAKVIEGQSVERVERETFSLVNTIDKMAQKRALVAATLIATGTSSLFTQDEETVERTEKPMPKTTVTVETPKAAAAATTAPTPAAQEPKPVADGPFWRDATPLEIERLFMHPEDAHGNARSKKSVELPAGCKYDVKDLPGEFDKQGKQKKSYTKMVDANVHGGDPTVAAGPAPTVSADVSDEGLPKAIAERLTQLRWTIPKTQMLAKQFGEDTGDWRRLDKHGLRAMLATLAKEVA